MATWIAAADTLEAVQDPARGVAQLKTDFTKFPSTNHSRQIKDFSNQVAQVELATALWRVSGTAEKDFLVQWFYTLPANDWRLQISYRFLVEVGGQARLDTPVLLKAIVADRRFDTTDWFVLEQILKIVDRGTAEPLVDFHELYDHQPNSQRLDQDATLASWRNMLRHHFDIAKRELPPAS